MKKRQLFLLLLFLGFSTNLRPMEGPKEPKGSGTPHIGFEVGKVPDIAKVNFAKGNRSERIKMDQKDPFSRVVFKNAFAINPQRQLWRIGLTRSLTKEDRKKKWKNVPTLPLIGNLESSKELYYLSPVDGSPTRPRTDTIKEHLKTYYNLGDVRVSVRVFGYDHNKKEFFELQ